MSHGAILRRDHASGMPCGMRGCHRLTSGSAAVAAGAGLLPWPCAGGQGAFGGTGRQKMPGEVPGEIPGKFQGAPPSWPVDPVAGRQSGAVDRQRGGALGAGQGGAVGLLPFSTAARCEPARSDHARGHATARPDRRTFRHRRFAVHLRTDLCLWPGHGLGRPPAVVRGEELDGFPSGVFAGGLHHPAALSARAGACP